MAISDQQIFDWLVANPTADDATIAAIMDQFDVTPADVARATGTDVADIQSRYESVTEAPTVIETPPTGGLNAVSVASEPTYTSYETESGTVYEPVYEPPPARDEPIYETPSVKEEPVYEPPPTPPPPPEEPSVYEPPSPPEEPVYEPPRRPDEPPPNPPNPPDPPK